MLSNAMSELYQKQMPLGYRMSKVRANSNGRGALIDAKASVENRIFVESKTGHIIALAMKYVDSHR